MSDPTTDDATRDPFEAEHIGTTVAAVAFVVAAVGAVCFVLAYVGLDAGGLQTQALGGSLVLALGGLGVGLVTWAQSAMPRGPHVEERHPPTGDAATRAATMEVLHEESAQVGRRSLLTRLLAAAAGAVGLSALAPLASLGPTPLPESLETGWRAGRRLVREDDTPIRRDEVPLGGAIAVFPEGAERLADSQVVLIRVAEDGQLDLTSARSEWTAAGHVAYSRLCTHMGCSVGLYQSQTQRLVCPCHQSAFQVMDGAQPRFGPATRPLPQLPIGLDDQGYLVATGDFDRPVGTAAWDHPSKVEERS